VAKPAKKQQKQLSRMFGANNISEGLAAKLL